MLLAVERTASRSPLPKVGSTTRHAGRGVTNADKIGCACIAASEMGWRAPPYASQKYQTVMIAAATSRAVSSRPNSRRPR